MGLDFKRLAWVLVKRLTPICVATALWGVTGYAAFMIGGVVLSILLQALAFAWPVLLQPVVEVLYEELQAQYGWAQVQRRTAFFKTFLPFFQAYKTILTTYPPALLTASAPEVAAQLDIFVEALHQVKAYRLPEPDPPFVSQCEDPYEFVQTTLLALRNFRDWRLQDCQSWRRELLAVLIKGRITGLRHAVQHVAHERPRHVWEACLADAAHQLEREAEETLGHWGCIQRAHADPAVRQHLATLLRLDSINRQAGLQLYLASETLQCTPAEVQEIMAYMRYDTVAAKLLALVEAPPLPRPPGEGRGEGALAQPANVLTPTKTKATPDV